jgi:hypothetical protein
MPLKSMKSFHFDLGDSSMGPIGLLRRNHCKHARRWGAARLAALLPDKVEVKNLRGYLEPGEYVTVYFDSFEVSVDDIDEEDEEEENDPSE